MVESYGSIIGSQRVSNGIRADSIIIVGLMQWYDVFGKIYCLMEEYIVLTIYAVNAF